VRRQHTFDQLVIRQRDTAGGFAVRRLLFQAHRLPLVGISAGRDLALVPRLILLLFIHCRPSLRTATMPKTSIRTP
jgi:hypothetical protein